MPVIVELNASNELQGQMAVIELQGELECRSESSLQSQFIGDIYFKSQLDGSVLPILVIGHHILNGKIQNLDKPIAIMERQKTGSDTSGFIIKAIVTKKITFKTRPKPIIVNQ